LRSLGYIGSLGYLTPSAGKVEEGLLDLGIASFVGGFFSLFLAQAIRFSSVHGRPPG
jgi:hypothetical protein